MVGRLKSSFLEKTGEGPCLLLTVREEGNLRDLLSGYHVDVGLYSGKKRFSLGRYNQITGDASIKNGAKCLYQSFCSLGLKDRRIVLDSNCKDSLGAQALYFVNFVLKELRGSYHLKIDLF
jgi:hypothetical protein